jgi:hypothetical protein
MRAASAVFFAEDSAVALKKMGKMQRVPVGAVAEGA